MELNDLDEERADLQCEIEDNKSEHAEHGKWLEDLRVRKERENEMKRTRTVAGRGRECWGEEVEARG